MFRVSQSDKTLNFCGLALMAISSKMSLSIRTDAYLFLDLCFLFWILVHVRAGGVLFILTHQNRVTIFFFYWSAEAVAH